MVKIIGIVLLCIKTNSKTMTACKKDKRVSIYLLPRAAAGIFWLILFITGFQVFSKELPDQIEFERITQKEGLPHSTVFSITQDRRGFMWFGTLNGAARFDGINFRIFQHLPREKNSISSNSDGGIHEDRSGNIWIYTWGGGINCFNPFSETFINFKSDPNRPNQLSENRIQSMYEDHNGVLWFGTFKGGLNRFNHSDQTFKVYTHNHQKAGSISNNRIWSICEDESKRLFVGTDLGLNVFDPKTESFKVYFLDPMHPEDITLNRIRVVHKGRSGVLWVGTENGLYRFLPGQNPVLMPVPGMTGKEGLVDPAINALYEDQNNILWIGTMYGGLIRYELDKSKTPRTVRYRNDPSNPASLSHNDIRCIFEDYSKNIWIGTRGGGISKFDNKPKKFHLLTEDTKKSISLSSKTVTGVCEDRSGMIWITTWGGGLNRFDRFKGTCTSFFLSSGNSSNMANSVSSEFNCVYEAADGKLWVGSWDKGVYVCSPGALQTCVNYENDPKNPSSLSHNNVYVIYQDRSGTMWVGTREGGLNRWDEREKKFYNYKTVHGHPHSLSNNTVNAIIEDKRGYLWVGTDEGLNVLNAQRTEFTVFSFDPKNNASLNNNRVMSLHVSPKTGDLWVGTYGGGLDCFKQLNTYGQDELKGGFIHYTVKDGLPDNVIYGILEDNQNNLWLSTNKGICRFDIRSKTFRNYDSDDGLQGNDFTQGAFFRSRSGEMFFGGPNGLNYFYPEKVKDNPYPPRVALTSFIKFGKPIMTDGALWLQNKIRIDFKDNYFAFEFASLEFTRVKKNNFSYRMEGFDTEWHNVGNRPYASYTNLDGGTYKFRVRSCNNDGIWNMDGASITIEVVPPFWQAKWFKLVVIFILSGMVFLFFKYRFRFTEKRRHKLETLVAERTRELEQINSIIYSLNEEMDFKRLLYAILAELNVIKAIEKAAAFVRDKEAGHFILRALFPDHTHEDGEVSITAGYAESLFECLSNELETDIFLVGPRENQGLSDLNVYRFGILPEPHSVLIMRIKVKESVEGYLVFYNFSEDYSFHPQDIAMIKRLKDFIASVFIKSRIMEELIDLNTKKNEFLGLAAHDLRNPLTAVINYVKLTILYIEKGRFDPQKSIADLEKVLKGAERMSRMINDLLDISTIESGKITLNLKDENLLDIIRESVDFYSRLASQKNITLTFEAPVEKRDVCIDRFRISEVIDNLLSNAIKYTYPGGYVEVSSIFDQNAVSVCVKDTGQGLDEEDLKAIFQSFKRLSSKPTGGEVSTGLGLTIAKKIIELHGGEMKVKSQKGEGAEFSFILPLTRPNSCSSPVE